MIDGAVAAERVEELHGDRPVRMHREEVDRLHLRFVVVAGFQVESAEDRLQRRRHHQAGKVLANAVGGPEAEGEVRAGGAARR